MECSFTTYADMHPERFICQVGVVLSEASGDYLNETPYVEPHVRCCGRRRAISRHLPDIETHRFPTTDITSKELDRPGFFWFEGEPIALVKKDFSVQLLLPFDLLRKPSLLSII